jgi:hypothetical protein
MPKRGNRVPAMNEKLAFATDVTLSEQFHLYYRFEHEYDACHMI